MRPKPSLQVMMAKLLASGSSPSTFFYDHLQLQTSIIIKNIDHFPQFYYRYINVLRIYQNENNKSVSFKFLTNLHPGI